MKHFTKKIATAILSAAMLASSASVLGSGALTAMAADPFPYGDLKYRIITYATNDTAGTVRVSSMVNTNATSITIPKRVRYGNKWYSVVGIEPLTFQSKQNLGSVKIQAPITTLPNSCFYGCSNLLTLELPETLTSLNNYAVAYCANLKKIHIPYACTNIYSNAFLGTELTEIHLHNGTTNIASNAFAPTMYPTKAYAYYGGNTWTFLAGKGVYMKDLDLGDLDANFFVNARDVQYYQRLTNPTADQKRRADIDRNGYVNQSDFDWIYDFTNTHATYSSSSEFEAWLSTYHCNNLTNAFTPYL